MTYKNAQAIFVDFYQTVRDDLSISQKGYLLDYLVDFGVKKPDPQIEDALVRIAYKYIKSGIEKAEKRYMARCEVNRENVNKRWGNKP